MYGNLLLETDWQFKFPNIIKVSLKKTLDALFNLASNEYLLKFV